MAEYDYTDDLLAECKIFRFRIATSIVKRGQRATGKTIAAMHELTPAPATAQLFAPFYFNALETGVRPSKRRPFPRPSYSFVQSLREWAAAKGFKGNLWALATSIIRKGTNLFQNGGNSPTITDVINETTLGEMRVRLGTVARRNVSSELRSEFPNPTK
jgi:hypothetical protein